MSKNFENKCTCGSKTVDHSIYCSIDFYLDPLSQGKYKPKLKSEKTCKSCFLVLKHTMFEKNQSICRECSS